MGALNRKFPNQKFCKRPDCVFRQFVAGLRFMISTDPAEQTDRVNTHAIRRRYIVIKSVPNHHRVLCDTVRLFQCPLEDSRIGLCYP